MITAALALCLMGGAASAQDRGDRGHDRGGGGHEERRGGPPGGGFQRGERGGGRGAPQAQAQPQAPAPGGGFQRGPDRGRAEGERRGFERGPDRGRAEGERRGFDGRGGIAERRDFDRGRGGYQRGPDRDFRAGGFLRDHGWRGGRFRAPSYRYPPGWSYRRWAFGAFLPGVFLAPGYTIGDYWIYGLPAPPPLYHWIRVGPDALLVRYGDGYILDVAYGIFY
jgi:Ni/Co efflux regulator RcnB